MILSDREIIAALKRRFIRITPEPDPSNSDIWSSTALDLTLDAKLQIWKAS
jgi:dCTP deaminase